MTDQPWPTPDYIGSISDTQGLGRSSVPMIGVRARSFDGSIKDFYWVTNLDKASPDESRRQAAHNATRIFLHHGAECTIGPSIDISASHQPSTVITLDRGFGLYIEASHREGMRFHLELGTMSEEKLRGGKSDFDGTLEKFMNTLPYFP